METAITLIGLALLAIVVAALLGFVAWLRTADLGRRVMQLESDIASLRRSQVPPARAEGSAASSHAREEPSAEKQKPNEEPDTGSASVSPASPPPTAFPPFLAPDRAPLTPADRARARVPAMAAASVSAQDTAMRENGTEGNAGAGGSSFEMRFGANWTVWIGGLALVLGGIFLVRYSIEAGLLPPIVRVLAGGVFAALLIGLGEWRRRRTAEDDPAEAGDARAYIPGILTLAGITSAFASAYAAHALYGLIGPAAAFVLLGAVALLTLAASLLHGPAVASVGLVASYAVPFLVSSDEPALAPVVFYGLFVTLATYAVARIRRWRWLAIAGAACAVAWAHVLSALGVPADAGYLAIYDIGALALAGFFFVVNLYPRNPETEEVKPDWMVSAILAAHALPALYLLQIDAFGTVSVATLFIVMAALLVMASEWPAVAAGALAAAVLGAFAHLTFEVPIAPASFAPDIASDPVIASALLNPRTTAHLHFGLAIGLLLGVAGLVGTWRSAGRWALAAAGTAGPLGVFAVSYLRTDTAGLETAFGLSALALAAAFAGVTAFFETRLPRLSFTRDLAVSAYAIATIAALVTGMAILLHEGWLVIGLALLTSGIAWVETRKPSPVLRWLAVAVAAGCCLFIADDPTIAGAALGTTPIFNWLLYGYGVPTIAFAATAWLLARRDRDLPQAIFEALTIVFALATVAMQIHHLMNGGDMRASADTLAEGSLHTLLALAAAIGLQKLQGRAGGRVFDIASMLASFVGFAMIALVNLIVLNPMASGEEIGTNALFNVLIPAYLLPAVMLATLVWQARGKRPKAYVTSAAVLSLVMLFAWVTLEVRALFHRPRLDWGLTGDGELYTYSAVWLVLGIALLIAGVFTRSRSVRLASAAVVALVVVKVFLIDMGSLTGIWRAVSFIGLGFVLIGIGALYQRLLRAAPKPPPETRDEKPA
ncbi:putative membrane protein [Breoghania corrubedonensis]|uniref:Putative membrane protein n=1 Tax=Breoghania corrubedonensis TaxID=665038 RepID=A0A2T5VG45_9HYPH|nr:DUF2339 domain-containing protein [Breoghania corrubedonensis]PTW62696.1 putative membrane protein [Breoghania corrubedonensis]